MMRATFLEKATGRRMSAASELSLVIRNLEAILNTKEGYGHFVRGFGLGQYTEKRGTKDLVEALTAEIKSEVEQHEPRLTDVDVKLRGRDPTLWLHFSLKAVLSGEPIELRIIFDTVSTQVRIERME